MSEAAVGLTVTGLVQGVLAGLGYAPTGVPEPTLRSFAVGQAARGSVTRKVVTAPSLQPATRPSWASTMARTM